MLKMIRLFADKDLFTLQGFGVPVDSILVGSFADARTYMIDRLGVAASEIRVARAWLDQRPDHNAVEFGVMNLAATVSLTVDVKDIHRRMGVGPSGLDS